MGASPPLPGICSLLHQQVNELTVQGEEFCIRMSQGEVEVRLNPGWVMLFVLGTCEEICPSVKV